MPKRPEPNDDCAPVTNVPVASGIAFNVCEHGTVHLVLLDENDKPFAIAPMAIEGWIALVDDVAEEIEEFIVTAEDEIVATHEIAATRH